MCRNAPAWPIMGLKALCYILWNMCYLICFSGLPSNTLLGSKLAKIAKMAKIDLFKGKITHFLAGFVVRLWIEATTSIWGPPDDSKL